MEVKLVIKNCLSHSESEERKITKTMKDNKKKEKAKEQNSFITLVRKLSSARTLEMERLVLLTIFSIFSLY